MIIATTMIVTRGENIKKNEPRDSYSLGQAKTDVQFFLLLLRPSGTNL